MKKVKLILILLNIIPVLLLCVGVGLFVLTNRIEESFFDIISNGLPYWTFI